MSDQSQGPGWWLASDGRWYPPQSAPAPPAPPGAPASMQATFVQRTTNGFAVASMVLGILWIYAIGSILALIFGYKARKEIDQSGGTQQGRGMATAGIVLGYIGLAGILLFIFAVVALQGLGDEASSSFNSTGAAIEGANN